MNILFVSPVGAFFSGAEVATAQLMVYLSRQGHRVYNVIPDNGASADSTYLEFMQEKEIGLFQLQTKDWWWQEAHPIKEEELLGSFAYHHKNIAQIREIIRDNHIELVISNTVHVFQGALAAAFENVPHWQMIHEFPLGEFQYYAEKISFIEALSDKIFAVSGGLYKELSTMFPKDKLFPFIPYSEIEKQTLLPAEKNRIVSIGGINSNKNQLELIKAYHTLSLKDIELIFIGGWEEQYKAELDEYIRENNLSTIHFMGYQSNPWKFISDKDILVFSSKMETFGLVYIEAVLAGCPVVAANNTGYSTIYELFGAGRLYQSGEVEDLANELQYVLEHYDEEKQVAEDLQKEASQAYQLEQNYQVFLDCLQAIQPVFCQSEVKALESLLGWNASDLLLKKLSSQIITVYHSNQKPFYKMEQYPLRPQDTFSIFVDQADYIRIDMTKSEGLYKDVQLVCENDGSILEPVHSAAVTLGDSLLFTTSDPQLVFDTSGLHGKTVRFSYRYQPMTELGKEIQNRLLQHDRLEAQLQEVTKQYHLVISSRRWTIPTKIINFFRRKP